MLKVVANENIGFAAMLAFEAILSSKQHIEPCNRPVRKRSCKTICPNEQSAHGPHPLEAALWKDSRQCVAMNTHILHRAHRSDAALGKRSFETVLEYKESAHHPHHLEPALRERSLNVV
eukprot:3289005-Amphidinium_carterae.1